MFNPIGNLAAPQPLTLVATALPNTIALRVPYDNVAPSVSSPEINNNARGNRNALPKTDILQNSQASPNAQIAPAANNDNIARYTSSAQTSFLAQLAAGDISPEVNGIFLQYEKLLSYANVKYKPSNAGKPIEPVGIFKNLLQPEKEPLPETTRDAEPATVITKPETTEDSPEEIEPNYNQPEKAFIPNQSQIFKYVETIARNSNSEPAELEVA